VIALILVWYVAVWYEVVDRVLLPSPSDTFRALWKEMTGGRLSFDFWRTVERTTLATLIAAAFAIPLGIFLRRVRELYRSVDSLLFLPLDARLRDVSLVPGAVRGRRRDQDLGSRIRRRVGDPFQCPPTA
jgi:ABC-type phosphate/phosphonate transport system permease subunit